MKDVVSDFIRDNWEARKVKKTELFYLGERVTIDYTRSEEQHATRRKNGTRLRSESQMRSLPGLDPRCSICHEQSV